MKRIIKKVIVCTLILSGLFQTTGVYALTKDESVYVKLNENGDVQSTSITEHLNDYSGNIINDKTTLNNIKNINGSEKFNLEGNDLIWETKGNDIFYQGKYNKDLPISIDVKYYLDGEEKTVNEMLGKKGNIRIDLTYKNNSYKNMNINGKSEKMYVPYMIVTTTLLNNNDNKNISVTKGKVIDNGVGSIVMALSTPGLDESLKLNDLKDFNKVEINYYTESFELNSIYSVVTTSLFDDNSLDMFGEVNNLYKSIDLLQSNMDTIVGASKELSDGTSQMNEGITQLNTRVQELTKKYQYYRSIDKNTLKEELIKIVESNIKNITPALEEEITNETSKIIMENKEELESAVITYTRDNTKKVVEEEVNKIISQLDFDKLIDNSLDNNMSDIQKNDVNYIIENYGLTEEQAKEIVGKVQTDTLNQVKQNISDENITDKIINALNDENYVSNLVNNYITRLNDKLSESLNEDTTISEYSKEIKDKIILSIKKDLEEGNLYLDEDVKSYISELVNKIIDNTATDLSDKYTEDYTNKVVRNIIEEQFSEENVDSKLREVLDIYEDDINQKVTVLDDTINTLSDSLNKLNDGSNQISAGMNTLSDGLDKYNKEGINKINKLVNGDVKTLQKRLDALIELSNENKMIDMSPSNTSNSSKIIFMIDSVSKPNNDVKIDESVEESKSSLWDKIKGLFN